MNCNQFFDKFDEAVNELKAAGGTVTKGETVKYMIRALYVEFSHIGYLIDLVPE